MAEERTADPAVAGGPGRVLVAVYGVFALAAGARATVQLATRFDEAPVAYLASVVLLPVLGVLWARTEPTRWAGTVLAVAAAAVGVMLWRLLQLWEVTGG